MDPHGKSRRTCARGDPYSGIRPYNPAMRRRTLLKSLAAAFAARPAATLAQQAAAATTFSPTEIDTLHAIADVVLPAEIGAEARRKAVTAFVAWFANYRQGADMGHGYGASTLRAAVRSVAVQPIRRAVRRARCDRPLARRPDVSRAARVRSPRDRRAAPERAAARESAAGAADRREPRRRFHGQLLHQRGRVGRCYRAEIQRDSCRTLDNSAEPPRPVK